MAIDVGSNDVWLVRLNFGDGKSVMYNVLHYRVLAVADSTTGLPAAVRVPLAPFLGAFSTAFLDQVKTAWSLAASNGVHLNGVSIQGIAPAPRSLLYTTNLEPALDGQIVSDPLPQQDAPTIVKRSIFGERWGVGRIFFVGTPESGQVDGLLTAGQMILIDNFADTLDGTLVFSGGGYNYTMQPVLFGKTPDGGNRVTPIADHELSDNVIKSQKRRRPGKGI